MSDAVSEATECGECELLRSEVDHRREVMDVLDAEIADLRRQLGYHQQWYSAMRGLLDIAEVQLSATTPATPDPEGAQQ